MFATLAAVTVGVLRTWLEERAGRPDQPLFPPIRGGRLSHDGLERWLSDYIAIAAEPVPHCARGR